jgi:hypothetical protein
MGDEPAKLSDVGGDVDGLHGSGLSGARKSSNTTSVNIHLESKANQPPH